VSTPQDVLDQLKAQISAFTPSAGAYAGLQLSAVFQDVTFAEFPFCEDFPALHINWASETDNAMVPGGNQAARELSIDLYVTQPKGDITAAQSGLADLVEAVRDAVKSDRTLGGLLNISIVNLPVSMVPSPIGTAYVGTRRINLQAAIIELLT